jgi:hypothetical protein
MSTYQYTDECDEISGFGNGYEDACRDMVIAGMKWFDENKDANPKYHGFENFFGLVIEDNEEAEKLTQCMNDAANGQATGAMMQACLSHVKYAKQHGWPKYIEMMETKNVET